MVQTSGAGHRGCNVNRATRIALVVGLVLVLLPQLLAIVAMVLFVFMIVVTCC